ncbi:MAG: DUF4968 domain-containing protein [Acidobacteria bacterium]|nr:DUF4968 domain-containing protein [Acidobacteriota bacterium]
MQCVQTKASWQAVGNVTRVAQVKTNGVVVETSSRARVSVEFFDIDVVRIRIAPSGKFEREFSYAFDYSQERKTPIVKVSQTPREIVVANAFGAKVSIARSGLLIRVFDENGELVVGDDPRRSTVFDPATGEFNTTKLRRAEVETYDGFGEKALAGMSRNGEYIVKWNTDTFSYPPGLDPIYQSIPFFYALYQGKAYGVFSTTLSGHFSIWARHRRIVIRSARTGRTRLFRLYRR